MLLQKQLTDTQRKNKDKSDHNSTLQGRYHQEAALIGVCSVYVNTRPLARGDLILLADQLISNPLTWIGNLKFKEIQIRV